MPLTTTKQMLLNAQEGGYAVGAFNIENMEMAAAVIAAAEELGAPVILQTTPSTVRYAGLSIYFANVAALAAKARIPIALHLDHGNSLALCAQAVRAGYTSVMIDGSALPLDENIALTRSVVSFCTPNELPVEGELGRVGGKEDDLESEENRYTDPQEAIRFERETGLSSMAVGIGTAHGIYQTTPVLNISLVSTLREIVSAPLVLHGASGLSDELVQACISRGICKVNFATELRIAYTNAVKRVLQEKPEAFDPKAYGRAAWKQVQALVKNKIRVCGSEGRV